MTHATKCITNLNIQHGQKKKKGERIVNEVRTRHKLELFNGIRFPVSRSAYATHYLNAPFIEWERKMENMI